MHFPFLALLLLLFADSQPLRTVENNVITSTANPAIEIKVSNELKYLGSFPFTLGGGVAAGERHVWAKADKNQRVTKLFILQFEGYVPGSAYSYNYKPRNVTQLGANDYNANGFLYDDTQYHKEHPGNEAEMTRKFLEARGYSLDTEQLLYRFYRSLPEDHRNEFLIFYIEPLKELGITMKDTTEEQDSEREKQIIAAGRERALQAFTVISDKPGR
jgi:hypothetical protein